jgi:hypothetical protein
VGSQAAEPVLTRAGVISHVLPARTWTCAPFYSYFDRPDLAKLLAKQTFTFYPNLLLVEVRLTLYACGFEKMPQIDLLGPPLTRRKFFSVASMAAAAQRFEPEVFEIRLFLS